MFLGFGGSDSADGCWGLRYWAGCEHYKREVSRDQGYTKGSVRQVTFPQVSGCCGSPSGIQNGVPGVLAGNAQHIATSTP